MILHLLFLYLLLTLFAFSIAFSLMLISTFSLRISLLSESSSMTDAVVVCGDDNGGGLIGDIAVLVTSNLEACV